MLHPSAGGSGDFGKVNNLPPSFLVDLLPLFLLLCAEIRVTTTWEEPGKDQQG